MTHILDREVVERSQVRKGRAYEQAQKIDINVKPTLVKYPELSRPIFTKRAFAENGSIA